MKLNKSLTAVILLHYFILPSKAGLHSVISSLDDLKEMEGALQQAQDSVGELTDLIFEVLTTFSPAPSVISTETTSSEAIPTDTSVSQATVSTTLKPMETTTDMSKTTSQPFTTPDSWTSHSTPEVSPKPTPTMETTSSKHTTSSSTPKSTISVTETTPEFPSQGSTSQSPPTVSTTLESTISTAAPVTAVPSTTAKPTEPGTTTLEPTDPKKCMRGICSEEVRNISNQDIMQIIANEKRDDEESRRMAIMKHKTKEIADRNGIISEQRISDKFEKAESQLIRSFTVKDIIKESPEQVILATTSEPWKYRVLLVLEEIVDITEEISNGVADGNQADRLDQLSSELHGLVVEGYNDLSVLEGISQTDLGYISQVRLKIDNAQREIKKKINKAEDDKTEMVLTIGFLSGLFTVVLIALVVILVKLWASGCKLPVSKKDMKFQATVNESKNFSEASFQDRSKMFNP